MEADRKTVRKFKYARPVTEKLSPYPQIFPRHQQPLPDSLFVPTDQQKKVLHLIYALSIENILQIKISNISLN